jgi:hypothetical protein
MLDNVFIDDHIGIVQILPMLINDFFQSHTNPPISALSIAKLQALRQIFMTKSR